MRKLVAGLAVFGLAISPIPASANTRAGASVPVMTAQSLSLAKRKGSPAAPSEELVATGLYLLVGIGLAVSSLVLVAQKRSRGA